MTEIEKWRSTILATFWAYLVHFGILCTKYGENFSNYYYIEEKQTGLLWYFERNWNNIKNTWKGIKSLISLKTVASNVPTVLSFDNGKIITNPYDVTNTFNNYFASIAETTKKIHKIFT